MLKFGSLHFKAIMLDMVVVMFCMVFLSGCQEQKQLDADISKTKLETDSLRIQLNTANEEYAQHAKSLSALESQNFKSADGTSYEEQARKLEIELKAMNDRNAYSEKDLQRLKEDLEAYKKLTF